MSISSSTRTGPNPLDSTSTKHGSLTLCRETNPSGSPSRSCPVSSGLSRTTGSFVTRRLPDGADSPIGGPHPPRKRALADLREPLPRTRGPGQCHSRRISGGHGHRGRRHLHHHGRRICPFPRAQMASPLRHQSRSPLNPPTLQNRTAQPGTLIRQRTHYSGAAASLAPALVLRDVVQSPRCATDLRVSGQLVREGRCHGRRAADIAPANPQRRGGRGSPPLVPTCHGSAF